MKRRKLRENLLKSVFVGFFVVWVVIPLFYMLVNIRMENIIYLLHSSVFVNAVKNSLLSTGISTLFTVVLAYILAFCIERVDFKGKKLFYLSFLLPMLIPSISSGMGLVMLFGNNGILTMAFHLTHGLYGMQGVVMGSVLYSLPVAFLMIADVLSYEDVIPYEAARVLGISRTRQFFCITLPYLKKPLIAVFFTIFTMSFTDYGIPLVIGGKFTTVPLLMYQEVIGQLNFERGAVYGLFLLFPAVLAFILDVLKREKNGGNVRKKHVLYAGIRAKVLAYGVCIVGAVYTISPIIAFIMLAFFDGYPNDFEFTYKNLMIFLQRDFMQYLWNSVFIAIMTSCVGVIVSFGAAYIVARMAPRFSKILHFEVMMCATIPGIVLGLAYVLCFKRTAIYGTIAILVMVNVVHFISSPYLMIYNSFSKISKELEAAASVLGIRRCYVIKDILIPVCKNTIIEMFSYFFVNSMITISAVSFLANVSDKPLALLINQFEAHMKLEYAAVVSLVILMANLVTKGLCEWMKNRRKGNVGERMECG